MAETLANGTTIPQGSDPIHGSGVQAMRNLGGSVDAQLGARYTKAQADALLAGKSPVGHTHSWAQVTGKPATFAPSAHSHVVADVTGLQAVLDQAAVTAEWAQLVDKPTAFPPLAHSHSVGDVTGLQGVLDDKVDTTDSRLSDARTPLPHGHALSDVDGLNTALDAAAQSAAWASVTGKPDAFPPTTHTHPVSDVTGLQTALNAIGYDSGERDITASVPDVASGRVLVWRLGRTVHLTFDSLVVSAPPTPHWLTISGLLPQGFRGAGLSRYYQFAQQIDSYAAGPIRIDTGGSVVIYNAKESSGTTRVIQGTVAFPTAATLPTILPGTPA